MSFSTLKWLLFSFGLLVFTGSLAQAQDAKAPSAANTSKISIAADLKLAAVPALAEVKIDSSAGEVDCLLGNTADDLTTPESPLIQHRTATLERVVPAFGNDGAIGSGSGAQPGNAFKEKEANEDDPSGIEGDVGEKPKRPKPSVGAS